MLALSPLSDMKGTTRCAVRLFRHRNHNPIQTMARAMDKPQPIAIAAPVDSPPAEDLVRAISHRQRMTVGLCWTYSVGSGLESQLSGGLCRVRG